MRKILLLAMCVLVSGLAFGQIVHNEITSSNVNIVSLTTVSDFDNNYDSYVVGTTSDKRVFIGQLDNYTPINLYSTSFKMFQMPNSNSGYFFNGAFVDMDGNIVAYGYCSAYKGIIVKYIMNGTTATSIEYSISNVNYTAVDDGCYGVLSNGGKVYGFTIGKHFMRIPYTINGANGQNQNIVKKFTNAWNSMSISWDPFNAKFIVSGTEGTNCFIGTFPNSNPIGNVNFNIYSMPANIISSEKSGGHTLAGNYQYQDNVAFLAQDFRDSNTGTDGIWVLKVDYINNNVVGNMGYKFDTAKVAIFDVAHNYEHLFVLGTHVGNYQNGTGTFCKRYLTQINLFDSTDVLTYHLNTIPYDVDPYKTSTTAYLSTIIFNPSTYFVQAAGTYNNNGYITEAYMLENETFDSLINNYLFSINYTASRSCIYTGVSISSIWGSNTITKEVVTSPTTETFAMEGECYSGLDRDFESSIENTKARLVNNVQLIEKNKQILPEEAEIEVQDHNTFVCSKFNGTCKYVVYDIQGKVVCNGNTQNGNTNYLNGLIPGLYLIKVTDSNNGIVTKKIVVY